MTIFLESSAQSVYGSQKYRPHACPQHYENSPPEEAQARPSSRLGATEHGQAERVKRPQRQIDRRSQRWLDGFRQYVCKGEQRYVNRDDAENQDWSHEADIVAGFHFKQIRCTPDDNDR